jgi:predicted  nucleic acid-binding Zn-ribbon protein
MTVPMKRAYSRKDKSPEAKAVEFVKEQSLEDKISDQQKQIDALNKSYAQIVVSITDHKNCLENKVNNLQKQGDALRTRYTEISNTIANHQLCLDKMLDVIESSWSFRIRNFMGF